MTFHLIAFHVNTPVTSGWPVYTELAPIADAQTYINPATNRFWSSRRATVFAAYFGSSDSDSMLARLYTPWKPLNQLRPLQGTVLPYSATLPSPAPNVAEFFANPLDVPPTHELIFDACNMGGDPTECVGLAWYTTGTLDPAPKGEVLTILGFGAATIPAFQWTEVTNFTWETQLPAGQWAIVGSLLYGDGGIAHRYILEGESQRPGGLSAGSNGSTPHSFNLSGSPLGQWGRFTSPVMPKVEVLYNAPAAGIILFLQVVRVS